jgi:hypothetical protein
MSEILDEETAIRRRQIHGVDDVDKAQEMAYAGKSPRDKAYNLGKVANSIAERVGNDDTRVMMSDREKAELIDGLAEGDEGKYLGYNPHRREVAHRESIDSTVRAIRHIQYNHDLDNSSPDFVSAAELRGVKEASERVASQSEDIAGRKYDEKNQ